MKNLPELRDKLSKRVMVVTTVASGCLIEKDVPKTLQSHEWLEVPGSRQTAGGFCQYDMCTLVKDYELLDLDPEADIYVDDRFSHVEEVTLLDEKLSVIHIKDGRMYRSIIDDTFHIIETTVV